MSKAKSNQLVVVNTGDIENAVVPKPTKTEIIDALVQVKLAQIAVESQKCQEAIEAQEKIAKQALLDHFATLIPSMISTGFSEIPSVEVCVENTPYKGNFVAFTFQSTNKCHNGENKDRLNLQDSVAKEIKKLQDLPRPIPNFRIDEKMIRREIKDGLEGKGDKMERQNLLLTNPASRTALEAMLSVIDTGKKKTVEI